MTVKESVIILEGAQSVEVVAKKSKAHRSRRSGVKRQVASSQKAGKIKYCNGRLRQG